MYTAIHPLQASTTMSDGSGVHLIEWLHQIVVSNKLRVAFEINSGTSDGSEGTTHRLMM